MKTWLITGASRGFGRIWAEAALQRGDRVVATARNLDDIAGLKIGFGDAVLPLALDVTNAAQVQEVVAKAFQHFGNIDVLLNNAGTSLIAAVEEASDEEIQNLYDANLFGMIRVIRAALPRLRLQGHGHIVSVSSSVGIVPFPFIGYYASTKAAIESLHESLVQEITPFGLKVTLVEPGAYATEFGKSAPRIDREPAYQQLRADFMKNLVGLKRGDPQATSQAILTLVDAENPPLRLALGSTLLPTARAAFAARVATWEAWNDVSVAAQGTSKTS